MSFTKNACIEFKKQCFLIPEFQEIYTPIDMLDCNDLSTSLELHGSYNSDTSFHLITVALLSPGL